MADLGPFHSVTTSRDDGLDGWSAAINGLSNEHVYSGHRGTRTSVDPSPSVIHVGPAGLSGLVDRCRNALVPLWDLIGAWHNPQRCRAIRNFAGVKNCEMTKVWVVCRTVFVSLPSSINRSLSYELN